MFFLSSTKKTQLPSQEEFNALPPQPDQTINFIYRGGQDVNDYLKLWMNRKQYGDFELTDAIRPYNKPCESLPTARIPVQGYFLDTYNDGNNTKYTKRVTISASAEVLPELFISLLEPLGRKNLEVRAYDRRGSTQLKDQEERYSENWDLSVIQSKLEDHKDVLCADGQLELSVIGRHNRQVILAQDRSIIVYTNNRRPYVDILENFNITRRQSFCLSTDGTVEFRIPDNREQTLKQFYLDFGMDEEYDFN